MEKENKKVRLSVINPSDPSSIVTAAACNSMQRTTGNVIKLMKCKKLKASIYINTSTSTSTN